MKSHLLFLAAWICIGVLTGCASLTPGDPEKAELLLRVGTSQMEAGDHPAALKSLLEAEKEDSRNPIIQNNLGLLYFFRERYEPAEQHLRRAIELKSDYPDAKNNLGRILIEKGQPREAIPILQDVLKDLTYDRPAKVTFNLGLAYFRLKNYKEARNYFNKTLQFGRDNCLARSFLGRTYFESQDFQKASETLDAAVGFCKAQQFDEPHYYSALAYYQLGEKSKAEARLEEVIKMYTHGKYFDQAKTLLDTMRR